MGRLPVRVRRATAADAAALAALYRGIRQWLLERGNRQWRDERFTADSLRGDIGTTPVLVATLQGRIVGAVYVQWHDPQFWPDRVGGDALYVRRLVVCRQVAGHAVADRLLIAVALLARRHHRWRLRLDCAPLETLARIYHRLSFAMVDESELGGYRVFQFERATVPFSPRRRGGA